MDEIDRNKHLICGVLSVLVAVFVAVFIGRPLAFDEFQVPFRQEIWKVGATALSYAVEVFRVMVSAFSFLYPVAALALGFLARITEPHPVVRYRSGAVILISDVLRAAVLSAVLSCFAFLMRLPEFTDGMKVPPGLATDMMILGVACSFAGVMLGQAYLCFTKMRG